MTATAHSLLDGLPRPGRSTVVWGAVLIAVEVVFVGTYLGVTGRSPLWSFLVFPFVWIDVGLWALLRVDPPPAPTRRRRIAAGLSVAYFGVLGYVVGVVAPGEAFGGNPATGLDLVVLGVPPGWAPYLVYDGTLVHVALLPPYVVGLLALTYLVYARLLDASSLASLGLVGIFSCVGCALPLLAAIVAGAVGASSGAVLAAVAPVAYELGMVVFVGTVAVLAWGPSVGGWGPGPPTDADGPAREQGD